MLIVFKIINIFLIFLVFNLLNLELVKLNNDLFFVKFSDYLYVIVYKY